MAERKKSKTPEGKAQWGNRPPGFQQRYVFTDEIVRELAGLCGINDDEKQDQLAEALEYVSGPLQAFAYKKNTDIPIRDQRAALEALKESADKLSQQLDDADLNTRLSIFSIYPNVRLNDEPDNPTDSLDLFKRDIEHVRRLRDGIDLALERLPSSGGRPLQTPLHFLCREYIEIYEKFSGQPFTSDRQPFTSDRSIYKQCDSAFLTKGSQFVETVAKAHFPDATDANIATAIRAWQKEKRP
jgi:hypothetical protein